MRSVTADDVPREFRDRVKALLHDLASDDIGMALLDLAQLHRALGRALNEPLASDPPGTVDSRLCRVYGEDGRTTVDLCAGPDRVGRCLRAGPEGPVACAGRWIMTSGWRFRIAADAGSCPLVELGLVRLRPAAGG